MTEYPTVRPFRVEVTVDAPRDAVWRALTDPAEIRRWFGWDYEGLDDEIRFIFVDHAKQEPPGRIVFEEYQVIELEEDGPRTIVRVVKPGPLAGVSWDDLYDEVIQGWRTFFQQLRHQLERHPGAERRTVYLSGRAAPAAALGALEAKAPGTPWDEGRHQRAIALDRWGGALVSLLTSEPLTSDTEAKAAITVTTYDVDDATFDEIRREWADWWRARAREPQVTS